MENAIDALKIAFAVIVFVMALTIAIIMFSQLNQVSQVVLASSDITRFYEYTEDARDLGKTRSVGLETVIPTLYKYYKENYTVLFLNESGNPLPLYNSQTNRSLWGSGIDPTTGVNKNVGNIGKYYTVSESNYANYDSQPVCTFDVDEETVRHEPWTGKTTDFKKNLDCFLNGEVFTYPSGGQDSAGRTGYDYKNNRGGFISRYEGRTFTEYLGEYVYNIESEQDNELLKERKKRVIIYQLEPRK